MELINRELLKTNAKKALKRNFWMIMLVCICANFLGAQFSGLTAGCNVYSRISGEISGVISKITNNSRTDNFNFWADINGKTIDKDELNHDIDNALENGKDALQNITGMDETGKVQFVLWVIAIVCIVMLIVYAISMTIAFLIGSFLGAPIGVGYQRFFMRNRHGKGKFTDLFAAFGKNRYMKIVKTMFQTNIEVYLWRLLFYFPGMVKFYQYYFVGYIMAENPNIDAKRAKEISKQMTNGYKWQIFVLQLSFIGWVMVFVLEEIFLAMISCGILAIPGVLLVYPLVGYQAATNAELYEERREYALMTGAVSKYELVGFEFED